MFQDHLPASRNTDPATSKKAEAYINETGKRAAIKRQCLQAIINAEHGMTWGEVHQATGLKDSQVWKRMSDLGNDGILVAYGERVWPETGRAQQVWHLRI